MSKNKVEFSRRDFIKMGVETFLGGSVLMFFNCRVSDKIIPESDVSFPFFEVSGSYYDIGYKAGKAFSKQIHTFFERRKKWFLNIKNYIKNFGQTYYKGLLESAKHYYPYLVEELLGWADGSGADFDDLMILNCKPEISAMMKKRGQSGCSTIVVHTGTEFYIGHNEDGSEAYSDIMFVLKVTPQSGVTFLTLTYPGILPGNAPALNNYGIIQTTNYIGGTEWKIGIPRYFLDRAVLEAKTIEEAIKIATHPNRAYSFHHILASIKEKKVFSLECSHDKSSLIEINDIYFHTNHFSHENMKAIAQFYDYVSPSSTIRYQVIEDEVQKLPSKSYATPQWIMSTLSSHRGSPYSPCRHPQPQIEGVTLASSLFDSSSETFYLYKDTPCKKNMRNYRL